MVEDTDAVVVKTEPYAPSAIDQRGCDLLVGVERRRNSCSGLAVDKYYSIL